MFDRIRSYLDHHIVMALVVVFVVTLLPMSYTTVKVRAQQESIHTLLDSNRELTEANTKLLATLATQSCTDSQSIHMAVRRLFFAVILQATPDYNQRLSFIRLVNKEMPPIDCPSGRARPIPPDYPTP